MSDRFIDIPGWDRFQHKDVWRKSGGRPPWIKTYTQLLHKDEYMDLSQSQRGILHGLWLMYASAGQSVGEAGAKRRLCRSDAEAKWWRRNLEALNDAGFIEFLSQPIRAPVAPRVEEKRVDTSLKDQRAATVEKAERISDKNSTTRGKGWIDNLGQYTGCRYVRGEFALTARYDPLGTEQPPHDWPYERPTREEIAAALEEQAVQGVA